MAKKYLYSNTENEFVNGAGVYPDLAVGAVKYYQGTRMMIRATFDPDDIAGLSGTNSIYLDMPIQPEAQPFVIEQIFFMAVFDFSGGEFNITMGTNSTAYDNLVKGAGDGWTPPAGSAQVAGGRYPSFYGASEMVDSGIVVGCVIAAELAVGDGVGWLNGTPRVKITSASATGHTNASNFSAFILGTSMQAQPFIG